MQDYTDMNEDLIAKVYGKPQFVNEKLLNTLTNRVRILQVKQEK